MSRNRTPAFAAAAIPLLVRGGALGFRVGTGLSSLWPEGLAPGCFLQPAHRCRPGALHRLLRLPACASRNLVAERCSCLLLGCAGHDDAVSESSGPRQRIRLVASVRFRASLHACAGRRVVANLRALALAGIRTGDAGPYAACRNILLWFGGLEFPGSRPAEFQSHGESIFPSLRGIPGRPRNRSQRYTLLSGVRTLSAGDVARPCVDLKLLFADCDCGDVERSRGAGRTRVALPWRAVARPILSFVDSRDCISAGAEYCPGTVFLVCRTGHGFVRSG